MSTPKNEVRNDQIKEKTPSIGGGVFSTAIYEAQQLNNTPFSTVFQSSKDGLDLASPREQVQALSYCHNGREVINPINKTALTWWPGTRTMRVTLKNDRAIWPHKPGKRGVVVGMSNKSRYRLMKILNTIDSGGLLPMMVTLTQPDDVAARTNEDWLRCKKVFLQRLQARGYSAVWRREAKARQSGDLIGAYADHLHLLVWGVPNHQEGFFLVWVAQTWVDVIQTRDANCLKWHLGLLKNQPCTRRARSLRAVTFYISKYISKADDAKTYGRSWGIVNDHLIPWAELKQISITDGDAYTLLRYLRRAYKIRIRSNQKSVVAWVDDPGQWARTVEPPNRPG